MRALGTTGLQVHPLCLGGNVFGWTADDEASFAVLDRYLEAGGTFIDTADVYSAWAPGHTGGESEETIGRWLADRGVRDRVIVATKVGAHGGAGLAGLAPETVERACDASRERLGVERIDLLYAHLDDESVPLDDMLGAFDALVGAGKIAHVGMSNVSPARLREMAAVTFREGYAPIRVVQPRYNLLDRAGFEDDLRAVCLEFDIACVPYYGLAMGFLTGKYRRDTVAADVGSPRAKGTIKVYGSQERAWRTLDVVTEIAAARGVAPATVALAWLAAQETVVAPIASARNVEQLEDLLAMTALELSPAELAALDAVSGGEGVVEAGAAG
jgi:aryl-alcohol dehydrogenase-like predicted oxidoreductase